MTITALVTDDSPTIRNMIAFTLKAIGVSTIEASDGQDALNKIETSAIDILIVDLNMPKINGLELISMLRKNPKYKRVSQQEQMNTLLNHSNHKNYKLL